MKVMNCAGRGRGVVATEDLCESTVVTRVSRKDVLSERDARNYLSKQVVEAVLRAFEMEADPDSVFVQIVMVVCAVLKARTDPSAPQFATVICGFPDRTSSSLLWDDEEVLLLRWPQPIEEIRSMDLWLRRIFLHLLPTLSSAETKPTIEEFKEIFCVVYSRGMDLSAGPQTGEFFIPAGADMYNFIPGRNTAALSLDEDTGDVLVRTTCTIKAGDEITVDYGGNRSNANLLLVYGFVTRSNPMDTIELPVPTCVKALEMSHYRRFIGPFETERFFKAARSGVDVRMKRAIRCAVANPMWFDDKLASHEADNLPEESFLASPTENSELENKVLDVLIEVCETALIQYSPAETSDMERVGDDPTRSAIANDFVAERRDVLDKLLAKLHADRS